jgi:hypothetical protein
MRASMFLITCAWCEYFLRLAAQYLDPLANNASTVITTMPTLQVSHECDAVQSFATFAIAAPEAASVDSKPATSPLCGGSWSAISVCRNSSSVCCDEGRIICPARSTVGSLGTLASAARASAPVGPTTPPTRGGPTGPVAPSAPFGRSDILGPLPGGRFADTTVVELHVAAHGAHVTTDWDPKGGIQTSEGGRKCLQGFGFDFAW